jgi:hypothetical protein
MQELIDLNHNIKDIGTELSSLAVDINFNLNIDGVTKDLLIGDINEIHKKAHAAMENLLAVVTNLKEEREELVQ